MGIRVTEVTKTENSFFLDPLVFEDSTTLLTTDEERLFISFDNGVNWEKSDQVPVNIWKVEIDENYRNSRAVATVLGELYLTEDQGKHWRKLNLPKLYEGSYELDTHPFEKDYLLAHCVTCSNDDEATRGDSYVSDDGGKNFRMVESPNTDYWHYWLECVFACRSRNSVFCSNKDLVYGFDSGTGGHVFYTDDFGKSINPINQFKNHMVSGLKILDSRILVFTSEDKFNWSSTVTLWVSNDGFTFNKAFLPAVLRGPDTEGTIEDGLGRIIIPTRSSPSEEQASQIFVSDSSGLQFHLLDVGIEGTLVSSSLKTSKTLKGTMLARFTLKHPDSRELSYRSKISFDYGKTWSNLRLIRSPDQPKDLFPCDFDEGENCSLNPYSFFDLESSQIAGILMTIGRIAKGASSDDKKMTFISRDSGRSWEVALKYPCTWAFGDGGNIIVAIPSPLFGNNIPKGEFYYSLDQGKTWKKYQLEVPIEPLQIISATADGSGLNFIISGTLRNVGPGMSTGLLYNVDFTGLGK